MKLRIGLAQRAPLPIDSGLDVFAADVARTLEEHPGIGLLVYPELHLNGTDHLPETERIAAMEQSPVPLDSDFVRGLGAIAAQHGIWLCPGSIGELGSQGELFNTQLIFDPAGVLRASYRKIFPWRPYEPHRPGTEFVVQDIDGAGCAGLSICYDVWFPEHSRELAWLGADLVLNVVKTMTPDREQELVITRANAIFNQNVVVSVNCAGPVGRGRSLVVDAEGFVMAEAGIGEQTLVVDFYPAHVAEVRARGTMYTNRMWSQFRPGDAEIPLSIYGGRIDPGAWTPRGAQLPAV